MPKAENAEEVKMENPELKIIHSLDEREQAARAAAARNGIAERITEVIYRLVAAGRFTSNSTLRAGPSGMNHFVPVATPRGGDSIDCDDDQSQAASSRIRKRQRNSFIVADADD